MPPPRPSGEVGRVMGSGEAALLAYMTIASGEPTLSKCNGGTSLNSREHMRCNRHVCWAFKAVSVCNRLVNVQSCLH